MEYHEAANTFPMLSDTLLKELSDDIKKNGLLYPIITFEGQILDGRNRFEACNLAGIEPRYTEFTGDPWSYVWSTNGNRRDLVAEQRYLIWAEINERQIEWLAQKNKAEANVKRSEATQERPRNDDGTLLSSKRSTRPVTGNTNKTRIDKAQESGTNYSAVKIGDTLRKNRPDLAEKVRLGELKPAAAAREMKKDSVAEKVAQLPNDKYRVIYADPPWSYNDKQSVKGDYGSGTGAAEAHYPSMSIGELCAMDIPSITHDDAVLFLWATSPLLPESLAVMKAWGFTYKASFIWDKVKHNMGHYNSVRHEFLLIGTKGSCTPDHVQLFDSVQSIERTAHSVKPEAFREIIDTLYIHGQKIELFARREVPGWEVYGNEV